MNPTRVLAPELVDAYFAWLEGPERERAARSLEVLEGIKADHGPGWAIYASAFFGGHEVRAWRQELISDLEEALS